MIKSRKLKNRPLRSVPPGFPSVPPSAPSVGATLGVSLSDGVSVTVGSSVEGGVVTFGSSVGSVPGALVGSGHDPRQFGLGTRSEGIGAAVGLNPGRVGTLFCGP